ncbi:hypothetical protein Fcan01_01434, partial [Folsomia candida]
MTDTISLFPFALLSKECKIQVLLENADPEHFLMYFVISSDVWRPPKSDDSKIQIIPSDQQQIAHLNDEDTISSSFEEGIPKRNSAKTWGVEKPYLISKHRIWRLRALIWLGRIGFMLPWRWAENRSLDGIVIEKFSTFWERVWNLGSLLVCCLSCVLTYFHTSIAFKSFKSGEEGYRSTFSSLQGTAWHSHAAILSIVFIAYQDRIRVYLNAMFLFNKHLVEELCQGQFDEEDDGSNLFYNWAYPFLWIEIFLSLSRYIVNYDAPLYLTSFLGTRDQIPWWFVLLGALQDFMTSTQLITGTLMLGYVIVTHAVTINFWLREAHRNNENVATKEYLRSQERAVQLFRAAQVLSGHFNLDVARCS